MKELFEKYKIYARARGFADHYIEQVSRSVRFFEDFLPTKNNISEITADDFRRFISFLRDRPAWEGKKGGKGRRLSATSVNTYARAIKAFFSWAKEEGIIASNPLALVGAPRKPKMLPKIYTIDELRAIFMAVENNIRNKAILYLFLDSGIRLSELSQLKIVDVDIPNLTVKVFGKGGKERLSYFIPVTAEVLKKYVKQSRQKAKSNEPFFIAKDGQTLSKYGIQSLLARLGLAASIKERLAPHKLRHTCATLSVKNDGNLEYIKKILGHSNIKTTSDAYLNIQDDDVKEAHAKFSPLTNLKHRQTNPPSEGTTNALTLSVKEDFKTTSVLKSPQDSQSVSEKTGRAGEPNGRNDGLGTHWDVFAPTMIHIETSPCIASPDDIATTVLKSWGVPAKAASDIILRWRDYHRDGKHQFCRLYLNFRDDLITRKISFGGAIRLLDASVEATKAQSEKLLQDVDIARIYQPWKSRNDERAYFAELRAVDRPFFEAREKYLNHIKDLLTRWLVDVNRCRSANEYGDIFQMEKDPLFEAMMQHCIKVESAFMKLKLAWQQLQNIPANNIHGEDVGTSGPGKKKQRHILQSKFEISVRELQKIINNTLRNQWYEDVWFFDYLQASKE